jgi:hypothetical protein
MEEYPHIPVRELGVVVHNPNHHGKKQNKRKVSTKSTDSRNCEKFKNSQDCAKTQKIANRKLILTFWV